MPSSDSIAPSRLWCSSAAHFTRETRGKIIVPNLYQTRQTGNIHGCRQLFDQSDRHGVQTRGGGSLAICAHACERSDTLTCITQWPMAG